MVPNTKQLASRELVDLWETLPQQGPLSGAMAAIATTAGRDVAGLDQLSLGERNALLLGLRRAQLGDALELLTACQACTASVEVTVSCGDVMAAARRPRASWTVAAAGYRLRMRPVTVADERAAYRARGTKAARDILVAAAIRRATRARKVLPPTTLPDEVLVAAGAAVLEHDQLAEIVLDLTCPECGATWGCPLDVVKLVSEELSRLGADLIGAVDLLARTYGWTEEAILALPETRRATYVALASA